MGVENHALERHLAQLRTVFGQQGPAGADHRTAKCYALQLGEVQKWGTVDVPHASLERYRLQGGQVTKQRIGHVENVVEGDTLERGAAFETVITYTEKAIGQRQVGEHIAMCQQTVGHIAVINMKARLREVETSQGSGLAILGFRTGHQANRLKIVGVESAFHRKPIDAFQVVGR